jgi:hypothetical protein
MFINGRYIKIWKETVLAYLTVRTIPSEITKNHLTMTFKYKLNRADALRHTGV